MILSSEQFASLAMPDRIREILKLAVHAPSTHNSQPWLFEVKGTVIEVTVDPTRLLPVGDPTGRYAHISIGVVAGFIILIAKHYGIYVSHRIVASGERTASVEISLREEIKQGEADYSKYVRAIEKRFNARGPFLPQPISKNVRDDLAAQTEGSSSVRLLETTDGIQHIAELTEEGMRRAHSDKAFRNELTQWVRNNYSKKPDGIPGYTMLAPDLFSLILPYILRWFNLGKILGKLNKKGIMSSRLLGIIVSKEDRPSAWVETGILFARCSLFSITEDIYPSIFVATIDHDDLRRELAKTFDTDLLPQFFFALGKPRIRLKQSPRIFPHFRMRH